MGKTLKFDDVNHAAVTPDDILQLLPQRNMGTYYGLKQIVWDMVERNKKSPFHTFTVPKGFTEQEGKAAVQALKKMFDDKGLKQWRVSFNAQKRVWLVFDSSRLEQFKKNGTNHATR